MAWLDPYKGPWTKREAAHLIRRASYGATKLQLEQVVQDGLQKTLTTIMAISPLPDPPVDPESGLTWVTGDGYNTMKGANYYNQTTKAWVVGLMLEGPLSIREKLTFFWMNHFATEASTVQQPTYTYNMMSYLREHALGNFRDLIRQVTIDPAMLVYLNGNTNTKGSANENYGREMQELFTIGKGPEVATGDYTNYSEQDVQAAAKVLTGWRVDRKTGQGVFQANQHDTGDKQFSHCYQNTIIKGRSGVDAGSQELEDLLTMILRQPATAEYIVGKLYRWFVNSELTDDVKNFVIKPLALQLGSNWEIKPILSTLFASDHFYDANIFGAQIRSPADLVIGTIRTISTLTLPDASDFNGRYRFLQVFSNAFTAQQMEILEPPNVAGWTAYYQTPSYYQEWLTTATLPQRNAFTDSLKLQIKNGNTRKYLLDSLEFVKTLSTPGDALSMITELNELFFAIPFSDATTMKLAEQVLMDGGREYEWPAIWTAYIDTPNAANTLKARTSLDRLFSYLFRVAEFQLF